MKKINSILIASLFVTLIFSACKKKKEPKEIIIDYREFFVGTYKGIRKLTTSTYVGGSTSTSTSIDSNAVYTFTKNGDYPSTEIKNQNGAIYFLDDKTHTTATNITGDHITVDSYKMKISTSYWFSSSTNYTSVFEGSKIQ